MRTAWLQDDSARAGSLRAIRKPPPVNRHCARIPLAGRRGFRGLDLIRSPHDSLVSAESECIVALTRTQVAVIGAGPAGLTVANLLRHNGIDCVLVESQSRAVVEGLPRAGFLEEWAVHALDRHGLADRLLQKAGTQSSFEFRFEGARHVFQYAELTGNRHFVYPQQNLVTDLLAMHVDHGTADVRFEATDVQLHDLHASRPAVTYTEAKTGLSQRIECDFVAGCDGAQGVSRRYFPAECTLRHDYDIAWLALLVQAPPSSDGVMFGIHPRGFAAHMTRSTEANQFYLQCLPGDSETNWPDERVWAELHARLAVPGGEIIEGPVIEKRVLDMHNYVIEPMSMGRLHLAGDSAHLVAPIGAKGMNLALHDALLLAEAITAHYRGDTDKLAGYSAAALARAWQYQEFSQWLSDIFHSSVMAERGDTFRARLAQARLRRLQGSKAAATAFAEIYLGVQADF
jgi:p-hydroxybenzoate 3-monooxygenase